MSTDNRIEKDLLGPREVPADALYGIHTLRAEENFPVARRPVNKALIHAYGAVKLACVQTNHELGRWDDDVYQALTRACSEMMEGILDEHIIVDALQGGAGTSTNMNVNEVLANRALQLLGKAPGDYASVHPLEDVNLHQSTNDTYPTALKVAALWRLKDLERALIPLLEAFQGKEKELAHIVKVGRTQMQDGVLTTLGREMSAYAEAFARDRWRVFKCSERLRVINLGGTAIGTGLGAPRQFIFQATEHLRALTSLNLARAENLVEATQNTDVFVEVSGILKALATDLFKVANDLRFLSSGPHSGIGEIRLPARQAGSSIMAGKVNPVIPEAVAQAAMTVMGHDQVLAQACAMGHLELNAFMPLVADALLDSLDLLVNACTIFRQYCVEGITADEAQCRRHVETATASVTALLETIGYEKATELARRAEKENRSVRELAVEMGLLTGEQFDELVAPEAVTRLGSRKT